VYLADTVRLQVVNDTATVTTTTTTVTTEKYLCNHTYHQLQTYKININFVTDSQISSETVSRRPVPKVI